MQQIVKILRDADPVSEVAEGSSEEVVEKPEVEGSEKEEVVVEGVEPEVAEPEVEPEADPTERPLTAEELVEENIRLKGRILQHDPYAFDLPSDDEPVTQTVGVVPEVKPEVEPKPEPEVTPPAPKVEDVPEYVSVEAFDNLLEDRGELNTVLHKIAIMAEERALKAAGSVVRTGMAQVAANERAIAGYYDKNPDLVQYRDLVETVGLGIISKRSGLKAEEVLKLAGGQVRKLVRTSARTPVVAKGGTSIVPKTEPKPTAFEELEKELLGD